MVNTIQNKIKNIQVFNNVRMDKFLFFCYVLSSSLFYNLQFSSIYNDTFKIILLLSYVLGAFYILLNYSPKKLLFLCIIGVLTLLFFKGDTRSLTIVLYTILLSNECKVKECFKIMFFVNFIFLLINFLFGFNHNNGLGLLVGTTIMQLFCIYQLPLNIFGLIGLCIGTFFVYLMIDSAQFLICMLLFFVLYFYSNNKLFQKAFNNIITKSIHVFAAFGNLFFAYALGFSQSNLIGKTFYSIATILDKLLSYRLSLTYVSLSIFSYKFWGKSIYLDHPSIAGKYFNIDSGYVQILQYQGLLVLIISLALLILIMNYLSKNNHFKMIIVGIVLALWAINEDILLSIRINLILLYTGVVIRDMLNKIGMKWGKNYEY